MWRSELDSFTKKRDLGIELDKETWNTLVSENKSIKDLIAEMKGQIEKSKQNRVEYTLKYEKMNTSADEISTPKMTQRPTIRRVKRPSFIPSLNLK